jgi:hypothetical protein
VSVGAQVTSSSLLGTLRVTPGAAQPLAYVRPTAGAGWLRRIVAGRPAAEVPDLLASLFALCSEQHRSTAHRALTAARGSTVEADAHDHAYLRAACLREHCVFWALFWAGTPYAVDLRGLPRLLAGTDTPQARLAEFARTRIFDTAQRWLVDHRAVTTALTLSLDVSSLLDDSTATLPLLAAELRNDPNFAEHASFLARPKETGAFQRAALPLAERRARHAYDLFAARLFDMTQLIEQERWLRAGAVALGNGQAIAYTEIARGLLFHWVQLSASGVVADYRVITPTDFCLHPQGALATRLRADKLTNESVALLLAAFDPCVPCEISEDPADA